LLRAGSDQVESLPNTGIPLGMFEEMAWKQVQIKINPGDILLLYTDGVPEAQNIANEEYGEERMIALGQAGMGQPAADTQTAIIDSINDFVGDAPQFDDITLMVVARDA
jgi:sigma-B regulation protein RsbU (phosphoserine phosphatase)